MTRPTSKTGPGNGATDSQHFVGLVNVALRQSKHVQYLLDTDIQAECKYRPPALLGPDGRAGDICPRFGPSGPLHPLFCFNV